MLSVLFRFSVILLTSTITSYAESCDTRPNIIVAICGLLEFTRIHLNLLEFAFFLETRDEPTDEGTDEQTDG